VHDRHGGGAKTKAQMPRERSRRPHGCRHETLALAVQTIATTRPTLAGHSHPLSRRLQWEPIRVAREPSLWHAFSEHDTSDTIDGLGFCHRCE
jgi:hypothetical protein